MNEMTEKLYSEVYDKDKGKIIHYLSYIDDSGNIIDEEIDE